MAPGESAGRLSVVGDSTHSASSILEIELGGTFTGEYDVLDVGGALTINDATLDISLISGFQPTAGNTFDILDFTSVSGTFGNILLPSNSSDWDTSQLLVTGILTFMGGSSVSGDFNGDGNWDCADINALTEAIATGSTDLAFDMNGDGSITLSDVTEAGTGWLAVGGANNPGATGGGAFLVGDADLNGSVEVSDFNIWNGRKFTSSNAWCQADFNADGVVDVPDFNSWNSNKFQSSSPAAVPEPGAFGLICLAGIVLAWHIRRK